MRGSKDPSTNATFAARSTSINRYWSSTKSRPTVNRPTTRNAGIFARYAAKSWRPRRASRSTIDRTPAKSRTPAKCAENVSPARLFWELTLSLTPENGNTLAINAAKLLLSGPHWWFISVITQANGRTFALNAVNVSSRELSSILIWSLVIEMDFWNLKLINFNEEKPKRPRDILSWKTL